MKFEFSNLKRKEKEMTDFILSMTPEQGFILDIVLIVIVGIFCVIAAKGE